MLVVIGCCGHSVVLIGNWFPTPWACNCDWLDVMMMSMSNLDLAGGTAPSPQSPAAAFKCYLHKAG